MPGRPLRPPAGYTSECYHKERRMEFMAAKNGNLSILYAAERKENFSKSYPGEVFRSKKKEEKFFCERGKKP